VLLEFINIIVSDENDSKADHYILAVMALGIGLTALSYLRLLLLSRFGSSLTQTLRNAIFASALKRPAAWYDENDEQQGWNALDVMPDCQWC
jgi:hypothetical protein